MIPQEQREEMRQEMLQEQYEEHKLRTDFDYAMEKVADDFQLQEAYGWFEKAAKVLRDYGYEMSPKDVFEEM